ncbi:MAG: hypothetical protein OHK0013_44130 [Sandaracinaceae bacterium]
MHDILSTWARALCGLCAVAALAVPTSAWAQASDGTSPQEAEARALHAAASVAFDQGRFEEAQQRFEQAYALSPRPALLYNIAAAADRAGHDDVALVRYAAYLEAMPDAPNRAFVEGRLRVLRARAEATARASEPSLQAQQTTEPAASSGADPTPAPDSPPSARIATSASQSPDPVVPATLFGLAGATGLAAIVTGVLGWSARSELELACPARSCSDPTLRADANEMEALGITTDVLAATSLAFAAAAVVVLVLPTSDGEAPTTVRLGPGGATLTARF